MKKITENYIQEALDAIDTMTDEEMEDLVEKFNTEQPNVMAYLMEVWDEELTEDDRELLLLDGLVLWYSINIAGVKTPELSIEDLEAVDEKNYSIFEELFDEDDEDMLETLPQTMGYGNQPDLLDFIIDNTLDMDEEEIPSETNKAFMYLALKNVVEVFDNN